MESVTLPVSVLRLPDRFDLNQVQAVVRAAYSGYVA
jgi:hypothetical protein